MFILFSSSSLPTFVGCCTPIFSPHLSVVSFHTIFPCRALCTHCGSPQRMKDVCFIHAKEDGVFLLKNTLLKYCQPLWRSWRFCVHAHECRHCSVVLGYFSLLLYVALSWSSVELFLELTSSWSDAPCLQGECPAKGPTWGILWQMALVWKPNSTAADRFEENWRKIFWRKKINPSYLHGSHSDSGR